MCKTTNQDNKPKACKKSHGSAISKSRKCWTQQEDQKLISVILAMPPSSKSARGVKWNDVAKVFGGTRTGKQCCQRWKNQLDPEIKPPSVWTLEEERKLAVFQHEMGNKWTALGKILGRFENNVKNHWRSHSFQKRRQFLLDSSAGVVPDAMLNLFSAPIPSHEASIAIGSNSAVAGDCEMMADESLWFSTASEVSTNNLNGTFAAFAEPTKNDGERDTYSTVCSSVDALPLFGEVEVMSDDDAPLLCSSTVTKVPVLSICLEGLMGDLNDKEATCCVFDRTYYSPKMDDNQSATFFPPPIVHITP